MDRHDVTELPQYFENLKRQKQLLRDAQSRRGQRPALRPRMETILQFTMRAMANDANGIGSATAGGMQYIASSFVPSSYPPCVTPFSELTKTPLRGLVLETHHRGSYLLVRCATRQDSMTAIMAIVEDESGDVVLLQLYHQEQANDPVENILEEGMILVVKEPYLKVTSDGGFGLRVDHVSDIEFLSPDDDRIPRVWQGTSSSRTALAWKTEGNDFFGQAKYRAAIRAYTGGLDSSPSLDEAHAITLNRSLAFIKRKAFEQALSDIDAAAEITNPTEKALFRKAQALYGLQMFRDCCQVLKQLCLAYPDNKSAKSEFARAISRHSEETQGRYDFRKMYAGAAKLRPPHLDNATHIGPVAIKDSTISPGGRGLFTTKPVSAGDLLFCEKAFAHAHASEAAGTTSRAPAVTLLVDTNSDRVTMGTEQELTNMIIRKLHDNPSLASTVTSLHHGSYQPVEQTSVDNRPIIDTFLVRRIIALNSFGCPLNSRQSHLSLATKPKTESAFYSSGIWPKASHLNHTCTSNAHRSFIGDMMIARATRNLPAGTELTWWYHPPPVEPVPYLEHQKVLLRTWGFMCKCALCRDLRNTPESVITKRKRLLAEFRTLVPTREGGQTRSLVAGRLVGVEALKKAEGVVERTAATYKKPAVEVPRLAVAGLLLVLAREWDERGKPLEVARFALAALEAYGFVVDGGNLATGVGGETLVVKVWGVMVDNVIDCWIFLRKAYQMVAPELVAVAGGYAKVAYRVCIGEDETFDETYGRFG
ncbi:hypothetical protein B0T14DRAFT_195653 [Immersiella caudata]|uniref:SET domain-containing protein n=1 Tax=Immersiella caudata TaxID=314043 RepID=A0AA39WZ80_9PEZI|nr:hypothetical protein B0T14DRAFT_195653 [Immersiella caudata]